MSVLKTEINDGIALLTLNRPEKMNAYNIELHDALYEAIDKADKNPDVRAIVVTGEGKAYCAGADLSGGFEMLKGQTVLDGIPRDFGGMLNLRIFECDTTIIGAVNGAAVGIGSTMLLPMDIKIVSDRAKFAFPFARRGIVFDGAASYFLPRIVGMSKAQEWIVTGRLIKADEALSAGMINEVVPTEDVLPRAMEIARDIAENVSPTCTARNKQLLRASLLGGKGYDGGPMAAHMAESVFLDTAFSSADCLEGVQAFFEKRAPKFAPYKG